MTRAERAACWCRNASTAELERAARRRLVATDLLLGVLIVATLLWILHGAA